MAANTVPETPAMANSIDMVSLQLSLTQMLDLALGTPEVGVVNFNILHNFLHVLLHQIDLRTTKVEYRGVNANRIKTMVTATKPPETTLHLHEYSITDGTGKVSQRVREEDGLEIEVFTEGTPLADVEQVKVTKAVRQQVGPEKEGEAETVIFVESAINGVLPTAVAFRELERSVKQLQQQYQALEELSETPEVVERLKGQLADPVTDIWQFININKRLDAGEQGIDKLTKMVQDVMKKEMDVPKIDTSLIDKRLDELQDQVSKIEQRCTCNMEEITEVLTKVPVDPAAVVDAPEGVPVDAPEDVPVDAPVDIPIDIPEGVVIPEGIDPAVLAKEMATLPEEPTPEQVAVVIERAKSITENTIIHPRRLVGNEIMEIRQDVATLKTDVAKMKEELNDLKERVPKIEASMKAMEIARVMPPPEVAAAPEAAAEAIVRLSIIPEEAAEVISTLKEEIEQNEVSSFDECMEVIKNVATTHGKVLQEITESTATLENQICQLSEKVDNIQATSGAHEQDINNIHTKMKQIQENMKKFEETADKMMDDKEKDETQIDNLMEQIELLKAIKADKEDLEDALADKADAQAVNRKVSHDQFDAVCDDLARGLEDAIDKLSKQEAIWQQALDEVQNEIAGKADRGEMTPLKDFVNTKLKSLQQKLKSIVEAKREIEAAGTKKLLRDVQCISCDKDVVMKTEVIQKFRGEPLPCTTSMKPYLTYELDQVRKQQKRLPHSRNMIQFEAIQEETRKKKEEMLVKTPRDHLCNRYCGGSHTITTPQQRVMRMGHFLSQWGPEVVQLTDGMVKGTDGQMYRSRQIPDVCEPACWETPICEEARPTERTSPFMPNINNKSARRSRGPQKRHRRIPDNTKEPIISELMEKSIEVRPKAPVQKEMGNSLIIAPGQDEIVFEAEEHRKIT